MRIPLLLLAAASLLGTACEASVQATAPNVANPVLLGPVDRVGGRHAPAAAPVGTFAAVLEDSTSATGTPVGTVSETTLGHDAKNVSFWVLRVTKGDASLDAHVDEVSTDSGCLFALFYAQCNETAVVVGRVTKHDAPAAAPAAPAVIGGTP